MTFVFSFCSGTETLQTGIYVFPNGDKYEGEYRLSTDGVIERQGRGVYTSSDGTTYSGEWAKDAMCGQGDRSLD